MTDRVENGAWSERRWWTLGVLCLSLVIIFVGNSSLNVAIPTMARDLHATTSQLQWVVAAYSLVFAGLLFTAGAIGDRWGRKGALQAGLGIFLVAAVLAAAASEMGQLIACRALMGVGAALIMPSTLSILVNVFPPSERQRAIAIWAGVIGAAGALGPVTSGWLLGRYWFGSIFLVNMPFIVAALLLGTFLVPRSRDPEQAALDLGGAALSIVGVSGIVFALIQAPDEGWASSSTLAALAVGAVGLLCFALWERRQPEPMLDLRYFRNPSFSAASAGMVLVFLAMYGVMFLVTQYFQLIMGFSPLSAALHFLPMAPIMMVVSPSTPRIIRVIGQDRTVAMGMASVAIGFGFLTWLHVDSNYAYLLVAVGFLATGISLAMSPMTAAIMSAVPSRRAGVGSAMNDASRELGAALGVAVLGSVAASKYGSHLSAALTKVPAVDRPSARASLAGALDVAHHLPGELGVRLAQDAKSAFVAGIHVAAMTGLGLAVVAAVVVARFLPRRGTAEDLHAETVAAVEDTLELALGGYPPLVDAHLDSSRDAPSTGSR